VHLGPELYIERRDAKMQIGDRVDVKGSWVAITAKPTIIAAEIKKGDSVPVPRDNSRIRHGLNGEGSGKANVFL